MSSIVPFVFDGQSVRVLVLDDAPWFVATDVCACLGIVNARDALARLDSDEKGVGTADTLGGPQSVGIVTEAGLYSIVLTSRRPEARAFKRWVTHEVIPSIRKTGGFGVAPVDFTDPRVVAGVLQAQLAKVAQLESTLAEREAALAVAAPKARAFDEFSEADGLFTLQNAGRALGVGPNRFITLLKERGVLFYQDGELVAQARYAERGTQLFKHRGTQYFNTKHQRHEVSTQTYVTPKGLAHFARELSEPQQHLDLARSA